MDDDPHPLTGSLPGKPPRPAIEDIGTADDDESSSNEEDDEPSSDGQKYVSGKPSCDQVRFEDFASPPEEVWLYCESCETDEFFYLNN